MNLILYLILAFVLVDIVIVFIVIYLRKQKAFSDQDLNFIKMNWFRVLDLSKTNPQKAIIDADKLIDFALKKKGKEGSLGEKLKNSKALFSDIDGLWRAHKLRNKIAHDFVDPKDSEMKSAISAFKNGLTLLVGTGIALGLIIAGVADYVAAKEIKRKLKTPHYEEDYPEYEDEIRDYTDENGYCGCNGDCCGECGWDDSCQCCSSYDEDEE